MKKYLLYISFILCYLGVSSHLEAQTDYTFELITLDSRANFGDVHNLYQDSAGVIWMGIYGKGLAYYNGKKIHRVRLPNEGNFSQPNDIFVADKDFIFLNYGDEVKLFDPIQQEIIHSIKLNAELKNKGKIRTVAITSNGDDLFIWATLELIKKQKTIIPHTIY